MKNNLNIILIILILLVVGCACSESNERYSNNSVPTSGTPLALVSSPTPTYSPNTTVSTKNRKTATVISGNANLHKTANVTGEVIETVSEGSSIQIIGQKGAWFYVRAGEHSGWIHGNTIRLNEVATQNKPAANPRIPLSPSPESTNSDSDYSGSSSVYHTGPRGGCYYYGGTGRKVYVDRSLCGSGDSKKSISSSSNGYIRGPRGGCYYITAGGNKRYVDRSLCD